MVSSRLSPAIALFGRLPSDMATAFGGITSVTKRLDVLDVISAAI
jgi:hypothetical protein